MQGRRTGKSKYLFDASEEEYQLEEATLPKTPASILENFTQLFEARERFSDFVTNIGNHRFTEVREDILSHCEQNSKRERCYESYMTDEMILKTINLRIDKMIKNKRIKKNWSEEDVVILIWVISKYADYKHFDDIQKDIDDQDWEKVAALIPGVSAESCMFKWLSLKKVNLATNNWSEEESILLGNLVKEKQFECKTKDSKDWKLISQRLYFLNKREDKIFRNAKQCRQHWNCYLNPNLKKGPWKPEEDILLLKCIKQNRGSKKWSEIVRNFDGRTENALKNRYTLIIEKQKKHNKHKNELDLIQDYLQKCYVDQFTTDVKPFESEIEQEQSELIFEQIKSQNSFSEYKSFSDMNFDALSLGRSDSQYSQSITPVTPAKVQKFNFKSFTNLSDIQIKFIQPGVLKEGIFEKEDIETDKSYSNGIKTEKVEKAENNEKKLNPEGGNFMVRRINSSYT